MVNQRLVLGLAPLLMLAGCDAPFPCSSDTVVRAISPSGRIEAVLDEENCGATTSFAYVVSLTAVGSSTPVVVRVASAYGAVRNDHAYGMTLVWADERTLEVQYWTTRWARIEHPVTSIDGVTITVRMKTGVWDEAAPAGGMHYNLQRRPPAGGAK